MRILTTMFVMMMLIGCIKGNYTYDPYAAQTAEATERIAFEMEAQSRSGLGW